jgi:mannan endo-1,4-beta-mannosidase
MRRATVQRSWKAFVVWTSLIIQPAAASDFVHAQDTQFILNDAPFYVTGVNNHYLPWGSEAEVTRVLDDAVAMGANVVRTFLGPAIGTPDGVSMPTIWQPYSEMSSDLNTNGMYLLSWDPVSKAMAINTGANGMARIDWLIAEADKRHLKLIIAFLDFWAYTGGTYQISRWYGLPTHQGAPYETDNIEFFTNGRAIADYRRWVKFVIERINPLTQRAYRDDPTIFAWELMNEAQAPAALHRQWESEMALYVKSLDPNHLVSAGDDHPIFDAPGVDFVTWHGYPKYLGIDPAQFDRMIVDNCALAKQVNKPILLEEFGYALSNRMPDQAQAYAAWLSTISRNPDCAGWVVWRLIARQDNGEYPADTYDQFDVINDASDAWNVLDAAAHAGRPAQVR